ncbi:MAG: TonB family protein [Candidatus Eisenbacteria bacterium]
MVHARVSHPLDDEDGLLAELRARRAEAEAALPRSLATSSLSMLTLVVFAILIQMAWHVGGSGLDAPAPPGDSPELPVYRPSPGYVPIPGTRPPVVPTTPVAAVLPVDDGQATTAPPLVTPTERTVGPGPVGAGTASGVGEGLGGSGSTVAIPDPAPGDYVLHDEEPQAVFRVQPAYPPLAQAAGMEGQVIVRLLIGVDGGVRRAEIERSSAMFDDFALAAARQWTFTPAKANGHPVVVWIRLPVRFVLH